MSEVEVRTRADFSPAIPPPASLPPENKVQLQLALSILLGLLVITAAVGAALGFVDKAAFSNIISVAIGGVLGLLTGGTRIVR